MRQKQVILAQQRRIRSHGQRQPRKRKNHVKLRGQIKPIVIRGDGIVSGPLLRLLGERVIAKKAQRVKQ